MGRAAIFIDGAYLEQMAHPLHPGWRADHRKLLSALVPPHCELLRAHYYTSPPYLSPIPTADERRRLAVFDRHLRTIGSTPRFDVRLGAMARQVDETGRARYMQKRVDVLLGVDMVRLATKRLVSELHLVAGDSDFVPAVVAAKEEGVLCVLHHGAAAHRDLVSVADDCRLIDAAFLDAVRRN